MNFSKVKLVGGGRHGLLAEYIESEIKNGFSFDNSHKCERKLPVPTPLVDLFKELDSHMRCICCLTDEAALEITGVTSNGKDKFIISGKVTTYSNGIFAINTPLAQEGNEYNRFDVVIEIINKIYEASNDYFEKKQSATPKEIVMDLFSNNYDAVDEVMNVGVEEGDARRVITAEDIEAMADGELQPLMIKALERKGVLCMVEEKNTPMEETTAPAVGDATGRTTVMRKVG